MHSNTSFITKNFYSKRTQPAMFDKDPGKEFQHLRDGEAFAIVGSDLSIIEASESSRKFLDFFDGTFKMSILEAIPGGFKQEVAAFFREIDSHATSKKTKVRKVIDKSGKETWLRIIMHPSTRGSSSPKAIAFLHFEEIDVEQESYLPRIATSPTSMGEKHIFEHSPIATAISSSEGRIIYANKALFELTGLSQSELLGKNLNEILSLETARYYLSSHHQDEHGAVDPFITEDKKISLRNGQELHVRWHVSPIKDLQGNRQFLYQLINITQLKHREEELLQKNTELQKSNKELEQFLYSASHDLRAPLRSILGLLLVMQNETNPDALRTYMDMMRTSVHKMDNFIKEIIDLSRNSRQDIKREKINMNTLVTDIFENFQYIPGADKIDFSLDIQQKENFYSDSSRLKVILSNLIANAITYHNLSKENPFIKVRFTTKGKYGTLEVEDNGRGIQKEHQVKIFDMFYRASDDSKGSGLGLYIVKEAVAKLNGDIRLTSTWGQGTKFSIKFMNLIPGDGN